MWHHVGLVRIDVSEESVASIIRVEKSMSEEKCQQVASRLASSKNTNYIEGSWDSRIEA
jgi:hypothetical protein